MFLKMLLQEKIYQYNADSCQILKSKIFNIFDTFNNDNNE